jgi:hypothetical protein
MTEAFMVFLQAWLVIVGLLAAGHYHCMANFLTTSPAWVKVMAGLTTASGTGMVFSGVTGDIGMGAMFSLAAIGPMTAIALGTFGAGAYISDQFRKAALIKQMGWRFVHEQEAIAEVARMAANSDRAPLEPEQKSH